MKLNSWILLGTFTAGMLANATLETSVSPVVAYYNGIHRALSFRLKDGQRAETEFERYARLYTEFSNDCADIEYKKNPKTNIYTNEQIVSMFWCTTKKLEDAGEI